MKNEPIDRIAAALERIAAALESGPRPEPAAEKPPKEKRKELVEKPEAEEPKPEPTASRDDVKDALRAVHKKHGVEVARGVLEQFGAKAISALDPSDYDNVLEAAKAAL